MATVLTFTFDLDENELASVKKAIEGVITHSKDSDSKDSELPLVLDWTMEELAKEITEAQQEFKLDEADKLAAVMVHRS